MGRRGRKPHPDILAPREWEVLALLREGLGNQQIAERLNITLDGAKYHVAEILSKLSVATREDAAAWSPRTVDERSWWLRLIVRLGPFTIAKGLAISSVAAALLGLAVLAWGLWRTSGDNSEGVAPAAAETDRNPDTSGPPTSVTPIPPSTPVPLAGWSCQMFDPPDDAQGIYIYDTVTCEVKRVTAGRDGSSLSWSHDGTKLAFARYDPDGTGLSPANSDIFVLDFQTGVETRMTFSAEVQDANPALSYDGSLLSFVSLPIDQLQNPDRRSTLKVVGVSEPGNARTTMEDLHSPGHSWSPVSAEFMVIDRGRIQLFDASGQILGSTLIEGSWGTPVWSSDGDSVAYSCSSGSVCTISRDIEGRVPEKLEISRDLYYDPVWRADGNLSFSNRGELYVAQPVGGRLLQTFHGWPGDNVVWVSRDRAATIMCTPKEHMVEPCARVWALVDPNTLGTAFLAPLFVEAGLRGLQMVAISPLDMAVFPRRADSPVALD